MRKKYKKSDLQVLTYGKGRSKLFIVYTDYEELPNSNGPWNTRVYPDVRGNKADAIAEALHWLNDDCGVGAPWVVKNKPSKLFVAYTWGA